MACTRLVMYTRDVCVHTYICSSRLKNPSLFQKFQQKGRWEERAQPTSPSPCPPVWIRQAGSFLIRMAPLRTPHCSAEAGRGALVLGALQEVEGHVAHIVHLIHLVPGTHTPEEAGLAEVSFLCRGEAGPREVNPPLPHNACRNRSGISAVIPSALLRSFPGFHWTPLPSSPPPHPRRCWRAQTSRSKAVTQSLAHRRCSEKSFNKSMHSPDKYLSCQTLSEALGVQPRKNAGMISVLLVLTLE